MAAEETVSERYPMNSTISKLGNLSRGFHALPDTPRAVRRAQSAISFAQRAADYMALTKPKIVVLELVVVVAAAAVCGFDGVLLLHALVGTALVAASASACNQWLERDSDARMNRTAQRPLPAGRLSPREVAVFGAVVLILGLGYLAVTVNWLTAVLGCVAWVMYVLIYTPLKRRWTAHTFVGAVAGALPVLIGWSAMGAPRTFQVPTLLLILFLWQFPHFMAIAWMYRSEYEAAGLRVLTVVDSSGIRAGAQAVVAALALIPISLIPALVPHAVSPLIYFGWALVLGVTLLGFSLAFLVHRSERTARSLLRASLLYLPALLVCLIVAAPR
jgi:protoheme IX farnesyltransferase